MSLIGYYKKSRFMRPTQLSVAGVTKMEQCVLMLYKNKLIEGISEKVGRTMF